MKVYYDDKLFKKLDPIKNRQRHFGKIMAARMEQRLVELRAAGCLEHMRFAPGHTHELQHDLKGYLSIHLVEPSRFIFKPAQDKETYMENGVMNWNKIHSVVITSFEPNYHD